jgi:catechol 2,3-dioxygenase-like lactoylglutathione lyase family enzyme
MAITRVMPNICSTDLPASQEFYVELLGFEVAFASDWFVQLVAPADPSATVGLLQHDHDTVPEAFRAAPQGVVLTVVVDDADAVHARALARDAQVVEPPHDTDYGQRRVLLRDPDGTLVDVSAPTAPLADQYRSG